MSAERVSGVDRAWLLMDRPTHPMTIVALIVLGKPLALPALRALIGRRLLALRRFRCVPESDALGATWVECADFCLQDHVLAAALPSPGGQRELETLAGELAGTPLPSGRPLWSFHLVARYRAGSAIIARIHHCYADGVALVRVLLSLADGGQRAPEAPSAAAAPEHAASEVLEILPRIAIDALRQGADLIESALPYARHPARVPRIAREALGIGGALLDLAALSDDPPTLLKRALSGSRRLAWAQSLSLEEVHTLGQALGCTVNDVLISTLAGALGRYLESQGEAIDGLTLRATVPVNLRAPGARERPDEPIELGNRFGLVFVELPVGIRHPLERLYAVHAAMTAVKDSPQAQATLGLLALVGSLPPAVEEFALGLFSAKASLVASNLPGPAETLRLAGRPVVEVLFWVPQSGSIGTGVSMLTYRGRVQFGVISDRELIGDPRQLVELLAAEFERLVLLVLLGGSVLT